MALRGPKQSVTRQHLNNQANTTRPLVLSIRGLHTGGGERERGKGEGGLKMRQPCSARLMPACTAVHLNEG